MAGWKVTPAVSIHPSVSYNGSRFGFVRAAPAGGNVLRDFDPAALINLNVLLHDVRWKGFDVDLGVRNLTDDDVPFIQPYRGYIAPLPSESRSFVVRTSYAF